MCILAAHLPVSPVQSSLGAVATSQLPDTLGSPLFYTHTAGCSPCPSSKQKSKPQRRRKNRKVIEPQVKVQSAAVDMVTGKAPASPVGEVETLVVQVLGIFFFVLLTEGLVLAGSVSVACCCCYCCQPVGLRSAFCFGRSGRAAADTLCCGAVLQGFLPAEWDPFFRDVLYPSFSPQMLLFLGMSSAYGLWKTGK